MSICATYLFRQQVFTELSGSVEIFVRVVVVPVERLSIDRSYKNTENKIINYNRYARICETKCRNLSNKNIGKTGLKLQ